ncbi:MAG: hypothetical protein MUO72_08500 [Bacteroidales bacterium]|nr:hypothetical protein [Bacteroidales bacterium]
MAVKYTKGGFSYIGELTMKNLLSKIAKPLLIPALALGLSTGIKAQDARDDNKLKFDFRFKAGFEAGISYSKQELEPYTNWESNFNLPRWPSNQSASLDKVNTFVTGDLIFGVKPLIKKGAFELGFPINFYLSQAFSRPVTKLKADLRDFAEGFKLKVSDIRIRREFPAWGISTRIGRESGIEFQYLRYKYSLFKKTYKEEVTSTCDVCGNKYKSYSSIVMDKTKFGTGQAQNFSIGFWAEEEASFSLYLEKAGKFVHGGFTYTGEF